MPQDRQIGFEVRTLNNFTKRYFEQNKPDVFKESTGVHGWAIRYFCDNRDKDIFQRDFELRFSIRRSTATNMLKLMEKNGIICRIPVDYDARLKKIVLTDKAIKFHKQATQNLEMLENSLKEGITSEELETFFNVIDKIKNNMEVKK